MPFVYDMAFIPRYCALRPNRVRHDGAIAGDHAISGHRGRYAIMLI